ncbi:hypothetical protein I546_1796 [Mycobacterium kansasii 732]|uniref:Uncharacterized protein n=1 Tax=Mycobacterium pseudokansasii TaxID=2341080 RepID=A0A498QWQ4_9MYCO|nr:hypothetical protein [Mycobacterium pseudokansasii]EUA13019.1 hypothetical protein I546_1796 [Mycobacterium kansasii 732]VAZ98387.1 hypothetical protein LAUMK35_04017 [Mycobacterium pseudokansasii]VAZ99884.1 hypothetical protein LAUMK21_04013 [Mycobacterium pseudokansasii]VBA53172.1 hypothetical protein LAUMK142_03910 [Mycobacterium pseudokansasii]
MGDDLGHRNTEPVSSRGTSVHVISSVAVAAGICLWDNVVFHAM